MLPSHKMKCYFCKEPLIDKTSNGWRFTCLKCDDTVYPTGWAPSDEIFFRSPTNYAGVVHVERKNTKYEYFVYYLRLHNLVLNYAVGPASPHDCAIHDAKSAKCITKFTRNFDLFDLSPEELYNKLKLYTTFS